MYGLLFKLQQNFLFKARYLLNYKKKDQMDLENKKIASDNKKKLEKKTIYFIFFIYYKYNKYDKGKH